MKIVIIKYNAGNIRSVDFALRRLGLHATITDDEKTIRSADKVIFPGVGAAGATMEFLSANGLDKILKSLEQPVLGICLGQQLMCNWSEEGDTDCIGIFDQPVKKFPPFDKVPHMGWNQISGLDGDLFSGIPENSYVYFVHSYYVPVCRETIATCEYILPFSAAMQRKNFYATQFHPEKSGEPGQLILENFVRL